MKQITYNSLVKFNEATAAVFYIFVKLNENFFIHFVNGTKLIGQRNTM